MVESVRLSYYLFALTIDGELSLAINPFLTQDRLDFALPVGAFWPLSPETGIFCAPPNPLGIFEVPLRRQNSQKKTGG